MHACTYLYRYFRRAITANTSHTGVFGYPSRHTYIGNQYIRKNINKNQHISTAWQTCLFVLGGICFKHIDLPPCKYLRSYSQTSRHCILPKILKISICNTHTHILEKASSVGGGDKKSAWVQNVDACIYLPLSTLQNSNQSKHTTHSRVWLSF